MINKNYLVEKRNILNEIRCNNMQLQELRFFTIYLAKIDPRRQEETRKVVFSLPDFLSIMEIGKVNLDDLRKTTDSLLRKVVNVPSETGGYTAFTLFKRCRVDLDEELEWYVEIDANDDALPLMFDFKERYFTYALWNALRLSSVNQLRMYEILKQYQPVGYRTVSVGELKKLLFLGENEYQRFNNFKASVLDACQKALKENTDIQYEYELVKKGKGGKVTAVKFIISENEGYTDRLSLDKFIGGKKTPGDPAGGMQGADVGPENGGYFERGIYPFLSEACGDEFSKEQIQVIYNLILMVIPYGSVKGGVSGYLGAAFDYLKRKYDELKLRARRKDLPEVKSRFGYIKKIIEADISDGE